MSVTVRPREEILAVPFVAHEASRLSLLVEPRPALSGHAGNLTKRILV